MQFESVRKAVEYVRTESVLLTLKRVGHVVSVTEASKIVGTDSPERFQYHLIRSMQEDHRANRPFMASLIVSNGNGPSGQLPPESYFVTAQQLGYNVGDRHQFWTQQLQRLGIENVRTSHRNQIDDIDVFGMSGDDTRQQNTRNGNRQQSGRNQNMQQQQSGSQGQGSQPQGQRNQIQNLIASVNDWYGTNDSSIRSVKRTNQNTNSTSSSQSQGQQSRSGQQGNRSSQKNSIKTSSSKRGKNRNRQGSQGPQGSHPHQRQRSTKNGIFATN